MFIYSWNAHSEGASALSAALPALRIKHENSKFRGRANKTVINWGSSQVPDEVRNCRVINKPEAVRVCSNKLDFFRTVSGVNRDILPDWCTSLRDALVWVEEGQTVMARTVLNGHSAAGLVVMDRNNPRSFVEAPLYTKYVPKKDEYRIHVVGGNVIDYAKKVLKREKAESGEEINWKVRNLDNGFIFQRENINPPEAVLAASREVVRITGLDFGAVDVIYNNKQERAFVLEINSAPGLQGQTIQNYANALRNL